jgi:uncharacterized membrane protein
MKLSSQKDLLLVITISGAVLILNWLGLLKGSGLSTLLTIFALFLPGYAIITAIWPDDESMGWTLRAGVGFVLGLVFVLFLPLIFNSLNWGYLDSYLYSILFILAILFSILAMVRRSEGEYEEEVPPEEGQLTLEESIERAALLRQQADADEYEDYYYEEEYPEEGYSEEELAEEEYDEDELTEDDHFTEDDYPLDGTGNEPGHQELEKGKPLKFERVEDFQKEEEYPLEDKADTSEESRVAPLKVDESIKTSNLDYEAEMDKPVWAEEPPEKKSGFKNWDMAMILFLTGISLLFLYFNPLKTTSTSIIFFILLLFIMGYAGLTIVFPDKSRTSTRNLLIGSISIAIILFILSFLAWRVQILPNLPKFIVQILFVASILLSAGAFIRKWQVTHEPLTQDEDVPDKEVQVDEIIPAAKSELSEEPVEKSEKKDAFEILKNLGKSVVSDEDVSEEPLPPTMADEKTEKPFLSGSKWEKALSVVLVISLIIAISATIYIIVTPHQGEKFTEFYILGPDGKASNYPTNLTTGQNGSLIMGVVNHEYTTTDYLLVIKVNNNTLKNQTLTLSSGEKMEIPYNFTAGTTGQKKMEFLLYKLPDNATAYRSLHLWLNVK